MGWRTIILTNPCRLNYKNNFLQIRADELKMVHLSEISTIILENSQISLSNYLLNELIKNKIQVIFCDERHNPTAEVMPFYASFNSSKKIMQQINWIEERKKVLNTYIIKNKIENQRRFLELNGKDEHAMLKNYIDELEFNDVTNREGHSAKVYFNALFEKSFTRDTENQINAMLDYGYTIILSCFNRTIVSLGYLTQLGINHKNEFNEFNFSCDLMEPFRVLVDEFAYKNVGNVLDMENKHRIVDILNEKRNYEGKEQYVSNIVKRFVENCIAFLNGSTDEYIAFEYEL